MLEINDGSTHWASGIFWNSPRVFGFPSFLIQIQIPTAEQGFGELPADNQGHGCPGHQWAHHKNIHPAQMPLDPMLRLLETPGHERALGRELTQTISSTWAEQLPTHNCSSTSWLGPWPCGATCQRVFVLFYPQRIGGNLGTITRCIPGSSQCETEGRDPARHTSTQPTGPGARTAEGSLLSCISLW